MLQATYADQNFSKDIHEINVNTDRIATSLEAISNHIAVLEGFVKQRFSLLQVDKEGFIKPV